MKDHPELRSLKIREANPRDIPNISSLVNAAFEVETFFVNKPRTYDEQLRILAESGTFLVGEEEGEIVASVYVEPRREHGYIGMIAVSPAHRGRGYGRAITEAAEDYLRQHGAKYAELTVVNLRKELPPMYRAWGYVDAGTEEPNVEFKAKLTQPIILLRMEKKL